MIGPMPASSALKLPHDGIRRPELDRLVAAYANREPLPWEGYNTGHLLTAIANHPSRGAKQGKPIDARLERNLIPFLEGWRRHMHASANALIVTTHTDVGTARGAFQGPKKDLDRRGKKHSCERSQVRYFKLLEACDLLRWGNWMKVGRLRGHGGLWVLLQPPVLSPSELYSALPAGVAQSVSPTWATCSIRRRRESRKTREERRDRPHRRYKDAPAHWTSAWSVVALTEALADEARARAARGDVPSPAAQDVPSPAGVHFSGRFASSRVQDVPTPVGESLPSLRSGSDSGGFFRAESFCNAGASGDAGARAGMTRSTANALRHVSAALGCAPTAAGEDGGAPAWLVARVAAWDQHAAFRADALLGLMGRTGPSYADILEAFLLVRGDMAGQQQNRGPVRGKLEQAARRYDRYALRLGEDGEPPEYATALALLVSLFEGAVEARTPGAFLAVLDRRSRDLRRRWRARHPERVDARRQRRIRRYARELAACRIPFRQPQLEPNGWLRHDWAHAGAFDSVSAWDLQWLALQLAERRLAATLLEPREAA